MPFVGEIGEIFPSMSRLHILGLDSLEVAHELLDPVKIGFLCMKGEMAVTHGALALIEELGHRGELYGLVSHPPYYKEGLE